jgi:hypothetical protein
MFDHILYVVATFLSGVAVGALVWRKNGAKIEADVKTVTDTAAKL